MNLSEDKIPLCKRYGGNKSWHLFGTICVLATFPVIFMGPHQMAPKDQVWYFVIFVVMLSFGWSTVLVAHLSLIPLLTCCEAERNVLTSIRYGATVVSYTLVFILAGALLGFDQDASARIGPSDAQVFKNIALICVGLGGPISLIIFHLTVKIKHLDPVAKVEKLESNQMRMKDWFTKPEFYIMGVTWMATMVFTNLSQAYMPLYIQTTLNLPAVTIAIIPFLMFFSGLLVSLVNKWIVGLLGLKWSMVLGCLVGLAGSIWILLGQATDETFTKYQIYAVAVLIGAAGSHMVITTYCLVSSMVGQNSESSGFVFGVMNMTDQFSTGITMMTIQKLTPSGQEEESSFYQQALGWTCFVTAVLGILAVCSQFSNLKCKKSLKIQA